MDWLIIAIMVVLSAFFSGLEIAFVASNKLRLELASKESKLSSRILTVFSSNPSRFITTMLVGNNIINVIYGIFMAKILYEPLNQYLNSDFYILLLQTIASTFLILIFAEFIPKVFFRIVNYSAIKAMAIPLIICYYLLYPIGSITIWLSGFLIRIFTRKKIDFSTKQLAFTKIDVEEMLESGNFNESDKHGQQELQFFKNVIDFSSIKLRECIIPRNKIIAVASDIEITDLRDKFIESGHSNILVYKHSIDEIEAYINVKDIFKNPKTVADISRDILIVPETMSAKKLFDKLIQSNKSLAVVVDEFGSTSGMVTLEDILEEIFGEFEDEHDFPEPDVIINSDGNYIMDGRQEVDLFNDEYDFDLSESDEYETIAGYILHHSGDFPKQGSIISITDNKKEYKFKILKIQDTKIEKIMLIQE
ncbi:MAG: HlyC/CorC family transporter [Bacteroidales bacterium]|jgi:CBS domain containing-hemolysin-like protein|nr:hemolysin family protein [Bacteroidales bacterium]MCK9498214.1 hemolysin family protein [Bacteroidales bacterium]MDY0313615.1 hemolysin family protein [Bacteroidales bacterium]NLB87147.1 HlyC/CorC family transporter [Bacteroidales bacterium]